MTTLSFERRDTRAPLAGGCEACPNNAGCAQLVRSVRGLLTAPLSRLEYASLGTYRSFLFLREALGQYGHAYPRVVDRRDCWFSDKADVVRMLERQAESLVAGLKVPADVQS